MVKTSALNALLAGSAPAAAAVSKTDPRVAQAIAMAEFRQNGGRVSPASMAAATGSLEKAPLAEEPFLLSGLNALVAENSRLGEQLLVEARRRNPRSRATRLLLLDRYLKTGRIDAAAAEIAVLNRLIPAANQVLIPELAKLAKDDQSRAALAATLRNDPLLQQEMLKHLAITGSSSDVVLSLARDSRSPASARAANEWQGILVQKLVEKGDIKQAHRIWSGFLGSSAAAAKNEIYDPSFEGKPGAPPFNWQLSASAGGVAERGPKSGLQVEYYGRVRTELASQVLMLEPGRYTLKFQVEGEAEGKSSRLAWKVECIPAKSEIADLPIRAENFVPKAASGSFTVPATGCSSQWLRLVGLPAEFPEGQSMTIGDVRVQKAS